MFESINLTHLVTSLGYLGVVAIIFLECGLFCFFLPGDSLLLMVGLLAAKGLFKLWILLPVMILVAILGYSLSYYIGDQFGQWLMRRRDSLFFKKGYLTRAATFYEKHGGFALLLGRLVPVVRTFVPVAAGMSKMAHRRFILYNILGGLFWAGGITLIGYFAGGLVPNIDKYILPEILIIIVVSMLPGVFHYVRERCKKDG